MKGLFVRWVVSAIALYVTVVLANLMHVGIHLTGGAVSAMVVVVVLAIVNALIRPLLLIITLPLNCLTLGLITWVINAAMFWLVGAIVPGFKVDGFLDAVIGSVLMGIVAGLMNSIITPKESV